MAETSTIRDRINILKTQDRKQLIIDRFEESRRQMAPQRNLWRKIRNAYQGHVLEAQRRTGRANFHIHKMFPQIEMESARVLVNFFTNPPFIQVDPYGSTPSESAQMHEAALQHHIEMAPTFYLAKSRFIKYCNLFGTGFLMPTWKREMGTVLQELPVINLGVQIGSEYIETQQKVYEGFNFHTFSPTEVFPYPYAKHMLTAPWCGLREFVHIDELLARAESGIYDKAKVMKIPLNSYGQEDWELRKYYSEQGLTTPEMDPDLICLDHMFSKDRFETVANGDQMIRDVKNFLYSKRIPLVQGVKTIDPDSFWPIGTGKVTLPNQYMRNLLGNLSIDGMLKGFYPLWKYKAGRVNPSQLVSLPNNAIPVQDMGDVDIMQLPELKQDIFVLMQMLDSTFEETTGYFGTQKGFSQQRNTATSDSIFQQEGNMRISGDIQAMEHLAFREEAFQLGKTLQQMMEDGVPVKMPGAGQDRVPMTRQHIQGEFSYKVHGTSTGINRAIMQKQFIEFFAQVKDVSQFVQLPGGQVVPVPLVNAYNAAREILYGFDNRYADRLLYRPEVFGVPLDNGMLQEFGMQPLPGLENVPLQGAPPPQGQRDQQVNRLSQGSRTVNPSKLLNNQVRQPSVSVT